MQWRGPQNSDRQIQRMLLFVADICFLYQDCTILGFCRFIVSTWGRAIPVSQVIESWCLCLEWLRSWRSDGIKHKKNEIFLDVAASFCNKEFRVTQSDGIEHAAPYDVPLSKPFTMWPWSGPEVALKHSTEAWHWVALRSNVWTSWFLRTALCCDQRSWELWRWSCSLSRRVYRYNWYTCLVWIG